MESSINPQFTEVRAEFGRATFQTQTFPDFNHQAEAQMFFSSHEKFQNFGKKPKT